MKKYIIKWNAGYGDSYETIEAESYDKAIEEAYEMWRNESENNADYGIVGEWTKELAEDYGVD